MNPAAALLALLPLAAFAQTGQPGPIGEIGVTGRIEAVTVYRGQALVTRTIDLPKALAAAGGTAEIIITDLPARLRPESLHAQAGDGVTVRSVRYRTRPVTRDTRQEVQALDASIEQVQTRQAMNRRRVELLAENRAYLQTLQQFVAPTSAVELTRGVLNAETLEKLSGYIIAQRAAFADQELALAAEAKQLNEQLEQAQRERAQLTAGSSRTVHEAVVLVGGGDSAKGQLKLRYMVDGATWDPSYTLRASQPGAGKANVGLEYYASIQQMSGEDWGHVAMTLSTATPSLIAKAPTLAALTMALGAPAPSQTLAYRDARADIFKKQRDAEDQRAGGGPGDAKMEQFTREADKTLNSFANELQVLDLIAGEKIQRQSHGFAKAQPEESLSVTYAIAGVTSLPSRNDRQLIQIAAVPLEADFIKIATPVLTSYVYNEASVVNTSSMVLLAGPMTAYVDGAFVGGGDLPTVAVGQRFTAGLGIDSSMRARRDIVERSETIQGGNRVVDVTYRLTIENFGPAAPVRLMDRLPTVQANGGDIRVSLTSPGGDLSSEAEYLAGPRKDGILRWDVAVPGQAAGTGAFAVEYTFKLEFDKQMSLTGMGS